MTQANPSDATRIMDIWFRTPLTLEELAAKIGLANPQYDAENYWEWVIGELAGVRVDITRTHRQPPGEVETRVFILGDGDVPRPFAPTEKTATITRLRCAVDGPIVCGEWRYLRGEDFNLLAIETY